MYHHTRSITATMSARSWPRSASPILLRRGLQVHLQTGLITASKLPDHGPQVHTIVASKYISPIALDHGLQVHLQSRSIAASKWLSKPTQLPPPTASTKSLDHALGVHLQTRSITATECISEFTRSSISGAPRIAVKHRLQPVQIYRV